MTTFNQSSLQLLTDAQEMLTEVEARLEKITNDSPFNVSAFSKEFASSKNLGEKETNAMANLISSMIRVAVNNSSNLESKRGKYGGVVPVSAKPDTDTVPAPKPSFDHEAVGDAPTIENLHDLDVDVLSEAISMDTSNEAVA